MKNLKNKKRSTTHSLISALGKKGVRIVYGVADISAQQYEQEDKKIIDSLTNIRSTHFSRNAALDRIYSRSFGELTQLHINRFLKQLKRKKCKT